ncbi:MAG: UDP-N-acetylmuramyl peptide synthase, partial [Coriobacteriales bacterium]|nr:UDP-N-acetylmuramyl peptide synthase [Coriobacteriales bacterium]
ASEYPGRPIFCVFGATGSKGSERRLDLPAVAVRYAKRIYITEDDPGEEPLAQINQQIAEVVAEAGVAYDIIEDRDVAIAHAIREAPAGSVVLILGKGHETVMKRGREAVPVPSDAECVRKVFAEGIHGNGLTFNF